MDTCACLLPETRVDLLQARKMTRASGAEAILAAAKITSTTAASTSSYAAYAKRQWRGGRTLDIGSIAPQRSDATTSTGAAVRRRMLDISFLTSWCTAAYTSNATTKW